LDAINGGCQFVRLDVHLAASTQEVFGAEHALGASQNRIFGRVIRMIFRWNLQHGWHWCHMRINHMTNHLGIVLVDQNDVDVVTFDEALEAILDFADGSV
jgi:hypothetical protein